MDIDNMVDKYSDMLYRLALHHVKNHAVAQDIVQDTFVKYLYKKPHFHNDYQEKAWLIKVASHLCKDHLKHWWIKKRTDIECEDIRNVKKEEQYELLEVVKLLPFHQRNAIYLYYYEEMSIKEIAHIYNVSENTVSSWLFRARQKLKVLLKGEWDNEQR